MIALVNLIDGEIRHVHRRSQPRLKGCADSTQGVEVDAAEERVGADFQGAELARGGAEAGGRVAEESGKDCVRGWLMKVITNDRGDENLLSDEPFRILT